MQRNTDKCSHCGRMFIRSDDSTPTVNRSGKTFHVSLFSGPDPRPNTEGGFFKNQLVCNFAYVDNNRGAERKFVVVYVLAFIRDRKALLRQIEIAADGIAELVADSRPVEPVYTMRGWALAPGASK